MTTGANSDEPDVVVVGLGPVGAVLTGLLARQGLRVVAVEKAAEPFPLPRAIAFDDEVLRVLSTLPGLDRGRLAPLLNGVQRAAFVDPAHRLLGDMAFGETDLGWPGLAFFHQPTIERALWAGLAEEPGVTLLTDNGLASLSQDDTGVTVVLADGRRVRASWAVACDGAASPVRHQLGIDYRGRTFAQSWLVVDLACDPLPHLPYFTYLIDPARPSVNMPMPGGHRFEWMVLPGDDPVALASPESVRELLAPWFPGGAEGPRVVRATVYAYHARSARQWRSGRVLLAGDAAHTMPPFAGQGLGAGVRDAFALAWRLGEVCRGVAGPAVLDGYERERRPHVKRMTDVALLLGAMLQPRSRLLAPLARRGVATVNAMPVLGAVFRRGGFRPRPADALPNPRVRTLTGAVLRLDELVPPGRWLLVGRGVDPREAVPASWQKDRDCAALAVVPPGGLRGSAGLPCLVVEDLDGTLLRARPRRSPVLVVRPDRVVTRPDGWESP